MKQVNLDKLLEQVLILPVLVVLVGAAALSWQMHEANQTVTFMQQADAGVAQTIEIERLMDDEETGLRGYQTTGDQTFLEPYTTAQQQLPAVFDELKNSGLKSKDQTRVLDLEMACDNWREGFAEPLISTMRSGGRTNDVQLNLEGKSLFDLIRVRIAALQTVFRRQRAEEISRWQRQVRRMTVALLVLALAVGLVIGLFSRRVLKRVSAAFHETNEELRLGAEQIFSSEQRLRTTLNSIGDGVITCDAEGRVLTMNAVAADLTGWSVAEAAGKPIQQVFSILNEETREPVEDPVSKVKRLNRVVGLEHLTLLVRPDGSEIAIDNSGAPIRDKDGSLSGVVMVFRDVTVERRSQAALQANEKLAVAGRLAATIAHEIHNPLDAVSNLLFLMDGQATPEESRHFLELARGEIQRVTQISRAMLSLYRESKAPVAVDVREMLESILLLMERRFVDLGIEVEQDLPEGLVVYGFPAELRQVFTNLLTNAAEASTTRADGTRSLHADAADVPDQPPLITVRARPCPPGFDRFGLRRPAGVLVAIADEGTGIPENVAENLFRPFYTTKGERGTGLGLWVSQGIMTKHGGSINFVSSTGSVDHGTTFEVFMALQPVINAGS